MDRLLILSVLFSLMLIVIRICVTGELTFIFLPWNLFLAAIPYFISTKLEKKFPLKGYPLSQSLFFVVWILFIPNSFYILTDLFHLEFRRGSSLWFDLTLILSFAWNGLLLGVLSVSQMEKMVQRHLNRNVQILFIFPVMWLIAFGIYIGRFMRFNSWDILTNPFELFENIGYMLLHPFRNIYVWAMILCFAVFMTLIYLSVKKISKTLQP